MQAEEEQPDVTRGLPRDAVVHARADLEARSHRDRLKRWQRRFVVVANNFVYLFASPKVPAPRYHSCGLHVTRMARGRSDAHGAAGSVAQGRCLSRGRVCRGSHALSACPR